MKTPVLPLAILAVLAVGTATAATRPLTLAAPSTATGAQARLFGAAVIQPGDRVTGSLAKLDGGLVAISKATATLEPETALSTLHAMIPSAHFRTQAPHRLPEVMIDATADADVESLRLKLVALGLENASVFSNDIGGWLPVDQLETVAALSELRLARASRPRTRTGAVTSQGDFAQRSDVLRAMSNTFDGRGVTVGVMSDSYNCYTYYEQHGYQASGNTGYASNGFEIDAAKDIASGDLPSTVNVLEDVSCADYGAPEQLPWTDEGRAILQIVHDVAPGASLAYHTAAISEADFANGIVALANAGAKIIDDDIGYPDEPFFQDGPISQAINQVQATGVTYFSSAGNDGRNSYENATPAFPVAAASGATNAGEKLLNFDASGKTTTTLLPITIPELIPGEYVALVVEWDQPFSTGAPGSPGSSNALDLCLTDSSGNIQGCSGANTVGGDPVVYLEFGNPANSGGNTAASQMGVEIGLASGAVPKLVKFVLLDDGAGGTINQFQTNSPTLQGHPGAAGAAAVGAAFYFDTPRCGKSPATLESYSSAGGDPILFDTSGNRLSTPVTRQKPDFVDADGGNDTFLGFTLASAGVTNGQLNTSIAQCQNNASYPNFFGTSAAAPHAAGIAALLLQAQSTLTPSQIISALSTTALPMATSSPNYDSGTGLVQADAAFSKLGLTAPASSSGGGSTTGASGGGAVSQGTSGGGGGEFGWLELSVLGLLTPLARRRSR